MANVVAVFVLHIVKSRFISLKQERTIVHHNIYNFSFTTVIAFNVVCIDKRTSFNTAKNNALYIQNSFYVRQFYVRASVHHKDLSITVQRDATVSSLFIYCKVTLHVSGVVAPIIRST